MDTMYDRLGDLLKETLEAGSVKFVKIEIPEKDSPVKSEDLNKKVPNDSDEIKCESESFVLKNRKSIPEYHKSEATGTIYHTGDGQNFTQTEYKPASFVYKKMTPDVERSYRILDILPNFSHDEIKKAYKDKIKYYHPDKYAENPVLQKVATEKTRQIVESYKIVCDFLEIKN